MYRTLTTSPGSTARPTFPAAMSALARSSPEEFAEARQRAERLLVAARRLADASKHDPNAAACRDAGCRLPELGDDGRLCVLVHDLGFLAAASAPSTDVDESYEAFIVACRGAIDAIRVCRQTVHPSGVCWFSARADADGCRAVLRLTHRLG